MPKVHTIVPAFALLSALSGCVLAGCGGGGDTSAGPPGGSSQDAGSDVSSDGALDGFVPIDGSQGEVSNDCPGGCDEGEICSHGLCVTNNDCQTDNDCSNDSYCEVGVGCVPWGTPPSKTYDPSCVYVIPPGQFAPRVRCEFSKAPAGDPFPAHTDVQATPVVVNFHNPASAGPPSIIAPFTATVPGGYTENQGVIRVLSGKDCSVEAVLGGVDLDGDGVVDWINSPATVAVGDLDGDGVAEIVAYGGNGTLLAFTLKQGTWSLLWKAKNPDGSVFVDSLYNWATVNPGSWAGPSIHDLDDDGHPEIIREGYVFSSEGVLLSGLPPNYVTAPPGINPVLANLDDDPAIEFTNGQYIWQWSNGQWTQETYYPAFTGPGYVAVADFGAYGVGIPATDPEIAIVRAKTVTILARDGTPALATTAVPGGGGGNPTIADYDGDGLPELGVAGADFYTVFDIDCTASPRTGGKCAATGQNRCDDISGTPGPCPVGVLWSRKTQDHSSNITGSSVFDFEADGKAEVVYADECFVRVYKGTDGTVLFSQYRSSCTWFENPVVADVDGNFRADLVVPSNLACSDGVSGIACGGLDSNGVDAQFAGTRCQSGSDCVSGTCDGGFCRCTSTAQCCVAATDADCLEWGYKCSPPPASVGGANTCRAAHPHGVTGIRVYSDAADKWVRSRTIWSQHAYAVTHIREDGVVYKTSDWLNNWEQPGLNNFRQNVPGTPNGQSTADPTAGASSLVACGAGGATLKVDVCNRGADAMGAGVKVGFYDGATKVCDTETSKALQPGECEQVSCVWADPPTSEGAAKDITVRANDDGALTECKAGNDQGVVKGVYCKPVT